MNLVMGRVRIDPDEGVNSWREHWAGRTAVMVRILGIEDRKGGEVGGYGEWGNGVGG